MKNCHRMNQFTSNSVGAAVVGTVQPEFVDLKGASAYSGLCRSHLYQLIQDGQIKSVCLRKKGAVRGRRLIFLASLRDFLLRKMEVTQ
jgi:hypothetical protein